MDGAVVGLLTVCIPEHEKVTHVHDYRHHIPDQHPHLPVDNLTTPHHEEPKEHEGVGPNEPQLLGLVGVLGGGKVPNARPGKNLINLHMSGRYSEKSEKISAAS